MIHNEVLLFKPSPPFKLSISNESELQQKMFQRSDVYFGFEWLLSQNSPFSIVMLPATNANQPDDEFDIVTSFIIAAACDKLMSDPFHLQALSSLMEISFLPSNSHMCIEMPSALLASKMPPFFDNDTQFLHEQFDRFILAEGEYAERGHAPKE
ncbi:uncharacterized protein MONOS_15159 [Monocercomonoides exilis]|uniref:uncharacterized protein n=1 Tax=Monocercomonoides exilis TaxID=2049356 RepID=UPI003559452B|nr:hypothetical protein MONOS_15159 [Monocercomonoides exilis]|eukprot:MONOS_15159.1-p1 / transcript=MONOS_15159.1 / gene=MONOS_15159 / organism=Monocercomonoides_exilis_PA203 / gene_product=unspecified product / transcript_product=unspecified product / location=Mono_scaffold01158:11223-11684(-) / protein_length=154 / sequence_SO=supercontig / SO=protein_coding / is_pseudo=false